MQARYLVIGLVPLMLGVNGCAKEEPVPPGLASASELRPDQQIRGAYIFRASDADASRYRRIILEPTVVYSGPEAAFGSISESERQRYARIVDEEFRKILGERFQLTNVPGPDVARIRVTLLGVSETIGGVATVTRVAPVGIAINAVRGVAGAGGSMTGGIEIAVEVFDSDTNRPVASIVRQEAPAIYDIEATLSTTDTVQSSARRSADSVRDAIIRRAPQMARPI